MKLAVLDRYGTLCAEPPPHLPRLGEWSALPGALEAVARLNQAGWHAVLLTAQPGLGRGLYDCAALNDYHRQMYKQLAAVGAKLDAVFFCPHAPEDQCDCLAAPQAQLLRQVLERFGVEASKVAVIGSRSAVLQAGAVLGTRLYRVGSVAQSGLELPDLPTRMPAYDTLQDCVDALIGREIEPADTSAA